MTPVEVTQTPWHYTTVSDALDHWQTALAGRADEGRAAEQAIAGRKRQP